MKRLNSYMTAWILPVVAALALAAALADRNVSAQAVTPLVDIATGPLFNAKKAHPNLAVALSVEFPTVGAAYRAFNYDRAQTYLGYFNPVKCYSYDNTNGYFYPDGDADSNHECTGKFSGNFMNWVSMSAVDEFRYALTGGNRVTYSGSETVPGSNANGGTVVERAYLPDGSISGVPTFYASGNFPRRTIDNSTSSVPNKVTPWTNATIYVTSCKNRIFFGTSNGGSCGDPADEKLDGGYYARVLVCDANEGPARRDPGLGSNLCMRYGNSYKPVGQIQRNAEKMRFSVFGYLMDTGNLNNAGTATPSCVDGDWNRCRQAGVLRANMRYVGERSYDGNLVESTNPTREINTDGSFAANPDGTSEGNSGMINYVNKFGQSGKYKRYDSMGELWYEALRYFQNLSSTTSTLVGLNDNAGIYKDGFPVYQFGPSGGTTVTGATRTTADPMLSRCQSNYIIVIGDTNTHNDASIPGNTGSYVGSKDYTRAAEGGLDAKSWTDRITTLETTSAQGGLAPFANPSNTNLSGKATGSSESSYLWTGAAYYAHTQDIRAGTGDWADKQTITTFAVDVDENSGIAFSQRAMYLAAKYGGFKDLTGDNNPNQIQDPNNSSARVNSITPWSDGTYLRDGTTYSPSNYLLASNPQKLIQGLENMFKQINDDSGTASGLAISTPRISVGGANVYSVSFNPSNYSGKVTVQSVSVDSNGNFVLGAVAPNSDAGTKLTARDLTTNPRNIQTTGSNGIGRPFEWTSAGIQGDTAYAAAMGIDPRTGAVDTLAQKRVNYLRGDRSDEGGNGAQFRTRASRLGDIINSAAVYVGPPTGGISDSGYSTFFNSFRTTPRPNMVYVGANDGMLHALYADGSNAMQEAFAYVPGVFSKVPTTPVSSRLNKLTDPSYSHLPYVDAVPVVREAKVGTSWKTVLVSGLGGGGQGVFALDVSRPDSFGASNVMWEFSDADDPEFGNVVSEPLIVKLRTGTDSSGQPVEKWFAVVTGYNNRQTSDASGQVDGRTGTETRGIIFLLDLSKPAGTAWSSTSTSPNYYKLYTPVSDATSVNGLGPVATLTNFSGRTTAVYAGDLQGNMWKFDFDDTGTCPSLSNCSPAYGTNPLFRALDASNNPQPITQRPALGTNPFGGTMVYFGTGKYLGPTDLNSPFAQQSFYAVWDNGSRVSGSRATNLVSRTVATASSTTRTITGSAVSYSGGTVKRGWYLDFPTTTPASGERSVSTAAVDSGFLGFSTITMSQDACGTGGGWIYQVNPLTGLSLVTGNVGAYISTVGTPGPVQIVEIAVTNSAEGRSSGERFGRQTVAPIVSGSTGGIAVPGSSGSLPQRLRVYGRVNWREIPNWRELSGF